MCEISDTAKLAGFKSDLSYSVQRGKDYLSESRRLQGEAKRARQTAESYKRESKALRESIKALKRQIVCGAPVKALQTVNASDFSSYSQGFNAYD